MLQGRKEEILPVPRNGKVDENTEIETHKGFILKQIVWLFSVYHLRTYTVERGSQSAARGPMAAHGKSFCGPQ